MNINAFKTMTRKKKINQLEQANGKIEGSSKKVSKTKSKTSKKPSVKKMEHANGKIEDAVNVSKELDQILGMRQKNPFKASSLAEFEESLKGKNLTDLREMCVTAGIFPSGNNTMLRKKLLKGFDSFMKGGSASTLSQIPLNEGTDAPKSDVQQRIDEIWSNKK